MWLGDLTLHDGEREEEGSRATGSPTRRFRPFDGDGGRGWKPKRKGEKGKQPGYSDEGRWRETRGSGTELGSERQELLRLGWGVSNSWLCLVNLWHTRYRRS